MTTGSRISNRIRAERRSASQVEAEAVPVAAEPCNRQVENRPVGDHHDSPPTGAGSGGDCSDPGSMTVPGPSRGTDDGAAHDVILESLLLPRGQGPLERRVGDDGDLHVGVLPAEILDRRVQLFERGGAPSPPGNGVGVEEDRRVGGHERAS